jgi:hypothetical protein
LNDVPTQLVVELRPYPGNNKTNDADFSSTSDFYASQHASSVLAIRVLEDALRSNQTNTSVFFSRHQQRRYPYLVKSPSLNDTFLFFTNVIPVEIENVPFNVSVDADRGTYRNVPHGPYYTHFVSHNTLAAVDHDKKTCWRPNRSVRKGDFFDIDFHQFRTKMALHLTIGHNHSFQRSLDARVSADSVLWASFGPRVDHFNESEYVFDLRESSSEFRYLVFNATESSDDVFQVCGVRINHD